jgi:2-oxoglutarate ferredoxin oxidoreductase subunit beta
MTAIKQALTQLNTELENVVIVSGIGCGSKMPHFMKTYGFEGLHGRALAVATGVKLANPDLTVIAVTGDGDGYGIGGNHFLHTLRRNLDITWIIENNAVYGLTKGQASPSSVKGFKSPSTPNGAIEEPVNPIALSIAGGATYVARAYSFDMPHLVKTIVEGTKHKGLAVIDTLQYCPTYNKIQTMDWFKQNLVKIETLGHDPKSKNAAMELALATSGKMPYGLFYLEEGKFTYDDSLLGILGAPAIKADLSSIDMGKFSAKYR